MVNGTSFPRSRVGTREKLNTKKKLMQATNPKLTHSGTKIIFRKLKICVPTQEHGNEETTPSALRTPLRRRGIIHHSPFTIHHSPFTIHHSPFTIHHSPFTIQFTIHNSPFTIHHSIHHSPFTIHHSPFTIHNS